MSGRTDRERIPFTKKQYSIIFKIALLEAMALALVVPSVTSSGELPATPDQPNELTNIQNSTATVTITAGTTQGTATITYSPAYTSVPKLTVVPHGLISFTSTISTPNPTAFFQSQPTTSWTTGMPATDTEIYGDSNGEHRIEINLANMASFRFGVNCIIPSNTVGAYLTIEYLTGGVWVELNSAQRWIIDNALSNCPGPFTDHLASVTYASIPVGAKQSQVILRVGGVGGGGVGDTPSFSSLWIEWSGSASGATTTTQVITGTWRACATLALCNASPPVATLKTGFVIAVIFLVAPTVTQTEKFTWSAGVII